MEGARARAQTPVPLAPRTKPHAFTMTMTTTAASPSILSALLSALTADKRGVTHDRASAGEDRGEAAAGTDSIDVSMCFYGFGEMIIRACSSDPAARLFAGTRSGDFLGEVRNGGGSTMLPFYPADPILVTITSSAGGSTTVPTAPRPL